MREPLAVQAASAPSGSLPRPLTSFIGREREVEAVRALLTREDARLVTLIGPGGVGKTRLSLRVAEGAPADDVWFVDLSSVFDPTQVGAAIGRALGVRPSGGLSQERALAAFLRDRRALLILDNFEQILDAAALVTELLVACPRLTVLVTSRSALRVSGEHRFLVPPLGLPGAGAERSADGLQGSEAVRLFVDRARLTTSDFTLTDANAADVAEICARLDGLPLAIELAAARVSLLTPADMRRRLEARLALLEQGPRDAPARLRSMRDSIMWSYDLLAPDEQALFRLLGALVGTWTLDAAEAMAGADDAAARQRVLEGLATLIDASLVRRQVAPTGEATYRMLVPIRELAEELLRSSPEAETARRRHAGFISGLALASKVAFYLPDGERVVAPLRIHAANIPIALAWLEEQGDIDELLNIAGLLAYFWNSQGQVDMGRALLERLVALGRASGSPALGRALIALAALAHMQGDEPRALALCREGRLLVEAHGDLYERFVGHASEGIIALRSDALEHAVVMQERALALVRSAPELDWTARAESSVLGHLGNIAVARGDVDAAERFFEEALAVQRSLGHEPGASHLMASHPVAGLGDVARARGDLPLALERYGRALSLARRFQDYRAAVYALGGVAGTLAAAGDWRAAARLFGAAAALHERGGFHFDLETMDRQRALGLPEPWLRAGEPFGAGQPLRDALWGDRPVGLPPVPDPDEAERLWREGATLSLEAASEEALAARIAPAGDPEPAHGLTPREVEVLRLVAEGATDAQIAEALFVSRRTVATHLEHIYTKLEVSSRAAATAWAVRHGVA